MEDTNQEQSNPEEAAADVKQPNDYETVILAAKLARKLNNARVVAKEQLAPEEHGKIDQRKVTTVALEDLKSGKVQILRQKEEQDEETYDLT
jgi:DNA-directed RNA polymerase omega subunit